jgi:class 3 adenylate cyclase
MSELVESPLESARQAMVRHAWEEALEVFKPADLESQLGPADLELLSEAAWWTGDGDLRLDALERAYAGYVRQADRSSATRAALHLAEIAFQRLSPSVGGAWMGRAARQLEGQPESAANGMMLVLGAFMTVIVQGDTDRGMALAERALEIGKRFGDADVEALALNTLGRALVRKGDAEKGLKLLDQSTVAAVGGELGAWAAGNVYCGTIDACRDLADWHRAAEWTDETERFLKRERITGGYPGICRIHRAEVFRVRGTWPEAEEEARRACRELESIRLFGILGFAQYEVGEVRLLLGDFEGAEAAFKRALELGRDPEPGLAMLRFRQGDLDGAAALIRRSLSAAERQPDLAGDRPTDPLGRAHLLPAQVEIALAVGDRETARLAADELVVTADTFATPAIRAAAAAARGAVLLADGDPTSAIDRLAEARRLWQEVESPYEVARARVALGHAYRALGDEAAAGLELQAAKQVFERLKATLDLQAVDAELDQAGSPSEAGGARTVRTFMFTDIVTSTDLLGAIGDRAWEDVLRWHDATLRSIVARHGGDEISHTGDGFFVAFDEANAALDAAIDIQRSLAAHRREHGFAPSIRIGLHTAEASRRGRNYAGKGVHVAARIGALAGRDEILVSQETLAAVGPAAGPAIGAAAAAAGASSAVRASDVREVSLKGIREPVAVATIDWMAAPGRA